VPLYATTDINLKQNHCMVPCDANNAGRHSNQWTRIQPTAKAER